MNVSMAMVGVAVAELGERGAFPGLVLAAVLGELERAEPVGQPGEGAAGVDLGELARVADEHHLRSSALRVGEELFELAGADHGGLVDHDHVGSVRAGTAAAFINSASRVVDGMPGAVLEPAGGPGGEADTGHGEPGLGPGVAGGGEREGLA